jgi:hypothetical protein
MSQYELPTVVFEPFPFGRPKEYQPGHVADQIMTWPDRPPVILPPVPFSPPVPPAQAVAGLPKTVQRPKPAKPSIPLDPTVVEAALDECERSSEAVRITTLANRIAKLFKNRSWEEFEKRKLAMFKQLGQMIRNGHLERVARRYVTVPRQKPGSARQHDN